MFCGLCVGSLALFLPARMSAVGQYARSIAPQAGTKPHLCAYLSPQPGSCGMNPMVDSTCALLGRNVHQVAAHNLVIGPRVLSELLPARAA